MPAKMKGFIKGLKHITTLFENEKEEQIEIGFPTDVRHVAHIGADGPSASSPSWMNDFGTSSEPQTGTITPANDDVSEISSGVEDALKLDASDIKKSRRKSSDAPKPRRHRSSEQPREHRRRSNAGNESLGQEQGQGSGSGSRKHSRRRKSKDSSGDGSSKARSRSQELPSDAYHYSDMGSTASGSMTITA